ncbi:transposase [Micromonospora zamorensis]|uniref:transposase n=1 Tax=Micromonospora zamorensis TaxID=709883 RepID=UPI003797B478
MVRCDRERWRELLSSLKTLRARWPDQRLYLILDNFFPHKHPEVRTWCAANQVELVFLPTYASWLNWIEAEFAARYFSLNGTDHRSHATRITPSRLHDGALGGACAQQAEGGPFRPSRRSDFGERQRDVRRPYRITLRPGGRRPGRSAVWPDPGAESPS